MVRGRGYLRNMEDLGAVVLKADLKNGDRARRCCMQ